MGDPSLEGIAMSVLVAMLLALFVGLVGGAHSTASAATAPSQTVIVVVGAPGESDFAPKFRQSLDLWQDACSKASARFIAIGTEPNGPVPDKELLEKTIAEESNEADAPLWLVLIGHGTFDGRTAKFNLRGPDPSAEDLAQWLKPITRPIAVIDTSPSSAPFLKALSAPNRVVITATKSGFEQSYTRFGQYISEAIIDPQADLDKDGQTSLLEAFLNASDRVAQFYAAAGRLATEHALLDDNGDAMGTPADWFRGIRAVQTAADGASLDGHRAHQFCLLYSDSEARMPAELRAKRDQLELQVMTLRDNRDQLPEQEYFGKLEPLLVEISRIYEQSDATLPN
jgi:hypothetical protein